MIDQTREFKKYFLLQNGVIKESANFLNKEDIFLDDGTPGRSIIYFIWTPEQIDRDEWVPELIAEVFAEADDIESLKLFDELKIDDIENSNSSFFTGVDDLIDFDFIV